MPHVEVRYISGVNLIPVKIETRVYYFKGINYYTETWTYQTVSSTAIPTPKAAYEALKRSNS